MGRPIARNIRQAGFDVAVYDIVEKLVWTDGKSCTYLIILRYYRD